jgi:hypothetical protein
MTWFPLGGERGEWVRGICRRELSGGGKEKIEYLSSLGKSHLLIQLCKDFQVERNRRVCMGNLHHLIYVFGSDEEQGVSG